MLTVDVDSYISLSDAQNYFDARLYTEAWDNSAPETQETALKMATKAIDRLILIGVKKDPEQSLAFPRRYSKNLQSFVLKNFNNINTYSLLTGYEDESVPQAVRDAVCEEALALLDYGDSQRTRLQKQRVQSVSISKTSENFKPNAGRGLLSKEAREFMDPWLNGSVVII